MCNLVIKKDVKLLLLLLSFFHIRHVPVRKGQRDLNEIEDLQELNASVARTTGIRNALLSLNPIRQSDLNFQDFEVFIVFVIFVVIVLVVADGRDDFDLVRVDGHLPGRLTPMVFNINTKIVKIEKIKFWEKYKSSYLKFPCMCIGDNPVGSDISKVFPN